MVQGKSKPFKEDEAFKGQTKPLKKADSRAVANVVAAVLEHFLDKSEWNYKAHKGSVTLSKKKKPKESPQLTVFVDYWNTLAQKSQLSLSANPFVVGVELTKSSAKTRRSRRDQLAKDFPFYADPRDPDHTKVAFKPRCPRAYDLVFLERGTCVYDVDGKLVAEINRAIRKAIDKAKAKAKAKAKK
jgi:hypothetical protein